jgi:hypothetical protein
LTDFQVKKNEQGGDGGTKFARFLQEGAALWILGIRGEKQHRIGLGAILVVEQCFVAVVCRAQMVGAEIGAGDGPFEMPLKCSRLLAHRLHVAF